MNTRSFILAALISGAALGVLSNLPLINFLNCFLCLWVWLGGIFAVYLYNRYERNRTQTAEASASPWQGAGVGAVAGLVGVVVGAVVYALTSFISNPIMSQVASALDINLPVQNNTLLGTIIGTAIFAAFDLFLYPLFGAIGGLLGAGVFWKKPQA